MIYDIYKRHGKLKIHVVFVVYARKMSFVFRLLLIERIFVKKENDKRRRILL